MRNKKLSIVLLFLIPISTVFSQNPKLDWVSKVGARPFVTSPKIFSANDYGAVNDGATLSSPAIQKAINECASKGGGIVTLKPGTYVSGSIFLKDKVNLRIDKGV
jgi:polygalacturonase